MDQKNQELLWQCREILSPLPEDFAAQELLIGLLLACHTASAFQRAHQAIEAMGGNPEDPEAYPARGVLFLPAEFRWEKLKTPPWDVEAGLLTFLTSIERRIPALRGAVQPLLWAHRFRPEQLERLLEISDVWYRRSLSGSLDFPELLEGVLNWVPYESAEKRFFTPREVARLLARLLRPEGGGLYDPCCGGGLLAALGEDLTLRRRQFTLYGHERDERIWKIAKIDLYFRGFPAELEDRPADALALSPDELPKADVVLGNPPYNSKWYQGEEAPAMDPRWKYGLPPKGNGNLAWLQHMLYTLNNPGVMSVVLNTSSLSSLNAAETGIRRGIVKDGLLEAVLLMPSGMFYGTNTAVSIWILRKGGEGARTLMLDARELGVPAGNRLTLDETGQQRILNAWQEFSRGGDPAEAGFCAVVEPRDIAERSWTLDPRKYIAYPPPPLPSWEELEEKDARLSRELGELLAENREILRRIRQVWEGAEEHEPGSI